ncbi:sulfite oxidase heme-binding subunit YedZ [Campylobacter sp. CCS1377]|uniref:Sulfite oxidase heme-binding subunit YedZ n=1 Tax=Campylobacter sp. CCS1377 TaxID=3158229 RepID=A0AAU7E754_9BACT|nr:sulfite oxidase heme-binding subunit YedZ [Campylobacter jejuni]
MKIKFFDLLAYLAFVLSVFYSTYCVVDNILFGFDLIKELYFYTGIFALIFLHLSAFFSLFKFKLTRSYPKILGLCGGIWVFVHFLVYFVFSKNLNLTKLYEDITTRVFEASGFVAFIMIFLMFLSSFKAFKKLQNIRKLAFICLCIASFHFFLSAKIPALWEYLALILSFVYLSLRYQKIFKNKFQGR